MHQSFIRISHHSYLPVLEVERGMIHILSMFSQNLDTSNSPASVQQELVLDFPCVLFVMLREQREQTFCKTGRFLTHQTGASVYFSLIPLPDL